MINKLLLIATASLVALSNSASAATVIVTITGDVASASDLPRIFGTLGTNLVGLPFSATLSYDPTVGERDTTATADSVFGGSMEGYPTPSLGASFTLNGKTFNIAGTNSTSILAANDPGSGYSYYNFTDSTDFIGIPNGQVWVGLNFFISHPDSPLSNLDNPYVGNGLSGYGQFNIATFVNGSFNAGANVQLTNFSISSPNANSGIGNSGSVAGAVPEPASWAMMIGGFGLLGAALRRQRYRTTKPSLKLA